MNLEIYRRPLNEAAYVNGKLDLLAPRLPEEYVREMTIAAQTTQLHNARETVQDGLEMPEFPEYSTEIPKGLFRAGLWFGKPIRDKKAATQFVNSLKDSGASKKIIDSAQETLETL